MSNQQCVYSHMWFKLEQQLFTISLMEEKKQIKYPLTLVLGSRKIFLSMFFTATQQLTWVLADSIQTLPNKYTIPKNSQIQILNTK